MSRKVFTAGILFSLCAAAQDYAGARHVIADRPLTEASSRPSREIARDFLGSAASGLGLLAADLNGAYVAREYTDAHNGVTHILYRQQFRGLEVHNSAYVVNLDSDGRVLNAGGNLYAEPSGPLPDTGSSLGAVRAAVKAVNPALAASFQPFQSEKRASRASAVRFAQGSLPGDVEGRPVWYGFRGKLYAAWVFTVPEVGTGSIYSVVVDSDSRQVFRKRPLTFFQNPPTPRGLVYERESPQPNPKPGTLITEPPPMVDRTLQSFAGDPAASPRGWVVNNETSGNNAVVGENLQAILPLYKVPTTKAPNGDFSFPLELGPGKPNPMRFADAVNTNLFYWINRAHDEFYKVGFTEAAGNFQQDNFGKGGIGGDPIYAYSHFGVQARSVANHLNAAFTFLDDFDGGPSFVLMFTGDGGPGSFFTDGSLDAPVVVHEYAHGVSYRLLPAGYDTYQVDSMGEAWSDYFGLEFTLPQGAPPDGVYTIGEYFDQSWAQGDFRSRPYSTNLEINPLTFQDLGKVIPFPEVHADGEIWFLALWDARANLIRQFGEKEGRRRMAVLVLDGIKLASPGSSMVDMRDAILLADRASFNGASQSQLWAAFAKRGLGATAYSGNPDTAFVLASFDLPSDRGKIAFSTPLATIGEAVQVVVQDSNYTDKIMKVTVTSSSGDVESLLLKKTGSVYTAPLFTTGAGTANTQNGILNLMPGDYISAYYDDASTGSGPAQIQATIPTQNTYFASLTQSAYEFPAERAVFPQGNAAKVDLPWDFPFFGGKYRTLLVQENGVITFGATAILDNPCTDRETFATIPAIAPMFVYMTAEGGAQANEGVYVTRTIGDSVTIRWAGETFTPFSASGLPGSPLNFAATLYYDGRIEFRYGKGNTELGNVAVPLACGQGPVIGISPGRDGFVQQYRLASYAERTTFRLDPPFGTGSIPMAVVESPKPGDTVKDVLTVSGVAYDSNSPIARVDILVDGIRTTVASVNIARADFCARQNVPGCPAIGWSANISTAALDAGEHTVQVRVTNSRGGLADYPQQPITFTTEAGAARLPFGKLESPAEGAEVRGNLLVRGYAAVNDLRVASVDTLIDGFTYGPTSYGIRRDDICGTLNPRPLNCPSIGFQLTLNTRLAEPVIPDGSHTIQIRVRDEVGRYTLIPETPVNFTVNNGAFAQIHGAITSIQPGQTLTGTVNISGYAYVPGATIRSAQVVVDGFYSYGTAAYGEPRPEVCATLTDVAACPNIGFSMQLDTTRLGNGPHTLLIFLATATDGFTIPAAGSPVMSVVIRN